MTLLKIENLSCGYGKKEILNNINLEVNKGEIFGIVGESGSGKSTLLKSIIGIDNSLKIYNGNIYFDNKDLLKLKENEYRKVRGDGFGVVFQNSTSTLNHSRKFIHQFIEVVLAHRKASKEQIEKEAIEMLEKLELRDPKRILNSYPFELSGGMNQRVSIALAMINKPKLLLADEPTSALDVSVEYKIINELLRINKLFNISILIITHNMGVAKNLCHKVGVMYKGSIIEEGNSKEVLENPQSEYTKTLLEAIPRLGGEVPRFNLKRIS